MKFKIFLLVVLFLISAGVMTFIVAPKRHAGNRHLDLCPELFP